MCLPSTFGEQRGTVVIPMMSQFGCLELLITRTFLSGPVKFEITRVDCIYIYIYIYIYVCMCVYIFFFFFFFFVFVVVFFLCFSTSFPLSGLVAPNIPSCAVLLWYLLWNFNHLITTDYMNPTL